MSNITKDQVIEWLSSQPVIELASLFKDLELAKNPMNRTADVG